MTDTDAPVTKPATGPMKETERIQAPGGPGRGGPMGGGMVGQKSMDFGPSAKRLVRRLRPDRASALAVVLLAVVSVSLSVVGPKILGHATDLIFAGLFGRRLEGTTKAEAVAGLRAQRRRQARRHAVPDGRRPGPGRRLHRGRRTCC